MRIHSLYSLHSINLIDKSRLQGEAFSYAGSGLVWKARLFLFLGFALIAGGFAGSCVRAYIYFYFTTRILITSAVCTDN